MSKISGRLNELLASGDTAAAMGLSLAVASTTNGGGGANRSESDDKQV